MEIHLPATIEDYQLSPKEQGSFLSNRRPAHSIATIADIFPCFEEAASFQRT
jgi:hypothetical protein